MPSFGRGGRGVSVPSAGVTSVPPGAENPIESEIARMSKGAAATAPVACLGRGGRGVSVPSAGVAIAALGSSFKSTLNVQSPSGAEIDA